MNLPTPQDRELWLKATQTPGEITDAERRIILGIADPETQLANSLSISGLTPEELEDKLFIRPESVTERECLLIQHGYHIWNNQEAMANGHMDWNVEDRMSRIHASLALKRPREREVERALRNRKEAFVMQRQEASRLRMARVAEEMHQPCNWVQRLIDAEIEAASNSDGKAMVWGFIVLRDAMTTAPYSDDEWTLFVKKLEKEIIWGVKRVNGNQRIEATRRLIWGREMVDGTDLEGLHRSFQDTVTSEANTSPHIIHDTFLLVTSEVMSSFVDAGTSDYASPAWIWAYEASTKDTLALVPALTPVTHALQPVAETRYEGRLKVSAYSLFTWFYAARAENIYSMKLFWEKAQQHPAGVWEVETSMGRYHHPLVLTDKFAEYLFNTYELDDRR